MSRHHSAESGDVTENEGISPPTTTRSGCGDARTWSLAAVAAFVALGALVATAVLLANTAFVWALDSAGVARPGAQPASDRGPASIASEVDAGAQVDTSVPSADRALTGQEPLVAHPAPTF